MVRVVVEVMPRAEILDPQGQAIAEALPRLGLTGVRSVRQGKRFELELSGEPDAHTRDRLTELAGSLLANPVVEDVTVHFD